MHRKKYVKNCFWSSVVDPGRSLNSPRIYFTVNWKRLGGVMGNRLSRLTHLSTRRLPLRGQHTLAHAFGLDLRAGNDRFPAGLLDFDEGIKFRAGIAYGQCRFVGQLFLHQSAASALDGFGLELGDV